LMGFRSAVVGSNYPFDPECLNLAFRHSVHEERLGVI
jgi:hypothetical protein